MDLKIIEATAKRVVEFQGSHAPQIMYEVNGTIEFDLIVLKSNEDKDKVIEMLRHKIQTLNIEEYVMVMEAYKHIYDKDTKEKIKTVDCIQIMKFRKDMKNESINMPFEKKGKKIIWGKSEYDYSEMFTRWNVYVENVLDEVVKQRMGDDFQLEK